MRQGSHKTEKGLLQAESPSFGGRVGAWHADYLTSADHVIPDWLMFTSLEEAETTGRLGNKSWFADIGLNISDFILDLFLL